MNTSNDNLKKLAKALSDLAEAVSAMAEEQREIIEAVKEIADQTINVNDIAPSTVTVEKTDADTMTITVKSVEESFIETAAETGEPKALEPKTVEETRGIVSKALKAGLKKEAKEILMKYGSSVSEVGEKTPEKLAELYAEIEDLLEKNNA